MNEWIYWLLKIIYFSSSQVLVCVWPVSKAPVGCLNIKYSFEHWWFSRPGITQHSFFTVSLFFFNFFNIYLFLRQRETERERGRGKERGRHRIWSRLQALSHQHRAWHGARTHKPGDQDLSHSLTLNQLSHPSTPLYFFLIFLTFIYFWDWERQSMNGGGAEREGDTESEAGSRLWAIRPEPDAGLELTDCEIVTWLKSDA